MKKILKVFALYVFILLINVNVVKAAETNYTFFDVTASVTSKEPKCPEKYVRLDHVGSSNATGSWINFYNITKNGKIYGQSYCLAPAKAMNETTHVCERVISPQKKGSYQASDVAVTYAYQQMVKDKYYTGGVQSAQVRMIGTLVFRWIEAYYGKLDVNRNGSSIENRKFLWENRRNRSFWNLSNSAVKTALKIAEAAVKVGDKIKNKKATYEQLVKNGTIWEDAWDISVVNTKLEGDYVTIKFDISAKNGHAPDTILWKQFEITCENGYKCSESDITKKKIADPNGGYKGRYTVKINTKNGKASADQKYGIKIKTAFRDKRNPTANMFVVDPPVLQTQQRMLVIKNYSPTFLIQTELKLPPTNECVCEEVNGKYTGNYILSTTTSDGNITTEKVPKDDPRVGSLGCPDKCTNSCSIEYDAAGNKTYYGNDGKATTRAKYRKDCLHICETPDQNDDNVYYCNEKVEDQGGQQCSEREYLDDCYCPPLKDKCEQNPNDPACDEYEEKCPNCNATVSVPGTCNNFNTESEVTGTISDINKTKTDCNETVNPVKQCVIDANDQTGASYEAVNELKDNRYCKVWCDEDYQFAVPTARYSTSGGYFTLSTKISGTRNCYVSSAENPDKPIDTELFEDDIKKINEKIVNAYNTWNANKNDNNYNKLVALNNEMQETIAEYNSCSTGWQNNMKFDPTIEFSYHEEEYAKISNGKFALSGSVSTTTSDTYCLGDTDNQYNCLSGALVSNNSAAPNGLYKNLTYTVCDNNGCRNAETIVSQAKWIQKSKTMSGTYTPNQNFSTYHQYGTVRTGSVCEGTSYNECLWTRLPADALPVELKTGKGAFPFVLKFSNIGQSNINDTLGRLISTQNNVSVLTEYNKLPDEKKCGNTGNNTTLTQESGYVCAYVNNCDECEVGCEGDNCTIHEECDGECEVSCKTCIFDGNNTTYKFRTVTLNDLFPNSCENNETDCRREGYNWQTLKAQVTRKEIEEAGESAYENPEYSYTLTQQQKANMRAYNEKAQTYANTTIPEGEDNAGENALKCEQYIDPTTGIEYSVKCRSTFLSSDSNKYFTANVERPDFTLWLDSNYCVTNGNCVLSRKDGIGPSWK